MQRLQSEAQQLRQSLIDRTKEFEELREQGISLYLDSNPCNLINSKSPQLIPSSPFDHVRIDMSTVEENKQLKVKLDILSSTNQSEKSRLELRLNDLIHNHNSEIAEMQYTYTTLQSSIDNYNREINQLKLQLFKKDNDLEQAMTKLRDIEDSYRDVIKQKEGALGEKESIAKKLIEMSGREETLQEEIRKLAELENNQATVASKTEEELQQERERQKQKEKEVRELETQLTEARTETELLKKELENNSEQDKKVLLTVWI